MCANDGSVFLWLLVVRTGYSWGRGAMDPHMPSVGIKFPDSNFTTYVTSLIDESLYPMPGNSTTRKPCLKFINRATKLRAPRCPSQQNLQLKGLHTQGLHQLWNTQAS